MKPVEVKINNFFSGISDSTRKPSSSEFAIAKLFDIFTDPFRLIPYRSFEADTATSVSSTDLKQYYVRDFLYHSQSAKLFGLGQNAGGLTKILYKADATTGNWTVPSSSEGNGAIRNGCLVEYKDYLWGFQGNTSVWKWGTLSGTPAITNVAGTVGTLNATVSTVAVSAAGSGYQVNDILTLATGSGTAKCIVNTLTAGAGSGVATVTLTEPGYNYATGIKATSVSPAGGTGCTINITAVANISTNITSIAQGVIGVDDNLYLPYNNVLVRVYPSGTVQDQVLKLPTNLKITSICNFGKYLAIGTAPISTFNGVSRVFLWNFTSPDVQEAIDWGEGELRVLETIEGMLVGITDRYLNNSAGAGRGSLIIQGYSGGYPQVLMEVFTSKLNGVTMPLSKTVKNNRVFFCAKIMTNSAGTEFNEGIWSFGRKNAKYPWALSLDYTDENISAGIQGFGAAANFFFIAHSGDGSVDKTNDNAVYTMQSIYESQTFDFGDATIDKTLNSVKVQTRPLLSGETVLIDYKVDGGTDWVNIGTFNTVGQVSYTFKHEVPVDKAFTSGREFKFRIRSTGGAEITGLELIATPTNTA